MNRRILSQTMASLPLASLPHEELLAMALGRLPSNWPKEPMDQGTLRRHYRLSTDLSHLVEPLNQNNGGWVKFLFLASAISFS